jgi:hypothetical protein
MLTNVRWLAAIAIPSFQGYAILGRQCFRLSRIASGEPQ